MGNVHPGVPQQLALFLKTALGLEVFIETGTHYGYTVRWAAGHFPEVHSIELSPLFHARASASLADLRNIHLHQGSSPEILRHVLANLARPAMLWLDAHWSMGETAGEDAPCPLLAELEIVLSRPGGHGHTILVDDASLFGAPPPLPQPASAWPSLADLTRTLAKLGRDEFFLFEDVIIIPPPTEVELVRKYLQMAQTLSSQSPLRIPAPLPDSLAKRATEAEAALAAGRAAETLAEACAMIDLAEGSALPAQLAGRAAQALGRLQDALGFFALAARLSPTTFAHHADLAFCAAAAGALPEACDGAEWAMAVDVAAAITGGLDSLRR